MANITPPKPKTLNRWRQPMIYRGGSHPSVKRNKYSPDGIPCRVTKAARRAKK